MIISFQKGEVWGALSQKVERFVSQLAGLTEKIWREITLTEREYLLTSRERMLASQRENMSTLTKRKCLLLPLKRISGGKSPS